MLPVRHLRDKVGRTGRLSFIALYIQREQRIRLPSRTLRSDLGLGTCRPGREWVSGLRPQGIATPISRQGVQFRLGHQARCCSVGVSIFLLCLMFRSGGKGGGVPGRRGRFVGLEGCLRGDVETPAEELVTLGQSLFCTGNQSG